MAKWNSTVLKIKNNKLFNLSLMFLINVFSSAFYHFYHPLGPSIWSLMIIKCFPYYSGFPEFVRFITVSYASQSIWFNFLNIPKSEVLPDVTIATWLLEKGNSNRRNKSNVLYIFSSLSGAVIAGLLLSSPNIIKTLQNLIPLMKHVPIKLPNFTKFLPSSAQGTSQFIKSIYTFKTMESNLFKALAFEAFLSFVLSFATFTVVNSKISSARAADSAAPTALKRFISGCLNYASQIHTGQNATLSFGVTALISGFSRDARIFVCWGGANMVGFIVAYFAFTMQRNCGQIKPIYSIFSSIFFFMKLPAFSTASFTEGGTGTQKSEDKSSTTVTQKSTKELRYRKKDSR